MTPNRKATPVFGQDLADCARCEMKSQCDVGKLCHAWVGPDYEEGGLMIVGEGPGMKEVQVAEPFVGKAGRLLDALLQSAGIDRKACWLTNATLGLPPRMSAQDSQKGGLNDRFPEAVYSCLPRLEAEIIAARPRVILPLGQAALIALTGYEVHKTKLVHFECDCDPVTRGLGPGFECALGDCTWFELSPYAYKSDEAKAWRDALVDTHAGKCPNCESKIKKLQVKKNIKCRLCGGKKRREEEFVTFQHAHKLIGREGTAGAVFRTEDLSSRLDEFGVKYIVPTYHPSFCLRTVSKERLGGADKQIGGQFAARASVAHMEKARELLSRDAVDFNVEPLISNDPKVVAEWLSAPGNYTVDIETDSFDGIYKCTLITCLGFARADRAQSLVIDGRMYRDLPTKNWGAGDPLLDVLQEFFLDETKEKTFWNGNYDRTGLRLLWGLDVEGVVHDGMVAHNVLYPDEEHGLGFAAHELTDAPAWKDAGYKKPHKGELHALSGYPTFEALAKYNAKDTRLTALVDEKMRGPDGAHGLLALDGDKLHGVYDIDMQMTGVALEMQWAGLPLNDIARDTVRTENAGKVTGALDEMRKIVGQDDFVPSGKALEWALYDPAGPCGFIVPRRTKTGQAGTAKEDLFKLLAGGAHPFIDALLRWKKHDYHRSHYIESPKICKAFDGRIHPVWKPWGARTGRWSSDPNCFDGATELLTPAGWVRFDEIDPQTHTRVAQYDPRSGVVDWVQPTAYIRKAHDGPMVHLKGRRLDLFVTPDHRCLFRHRKLDRLHRFKTVTAKDAPQDYDWHSIHAGRLTRDVSRPTDVAWRTLECATQADGHYPAGGRQVVFNFAKERKIRRLLWALDEVGAAYSVRSKAPSQYTHKGELRQGRPQTRIAISGDVAEQLRETFPDKQFTWAWAWGLTAEEHEYVADEIFLWDGCATRGNHYASKDKQNADVVQALIATSGRRATMRRYAPAGTGAVSWQVDRCRDDSVGTGRVEKTTERWRGDVYCVSVPTGYIVVRRNNEITIAGQCQNWPKYMRSMIIAPAGRVIVGADYDQLELRISAALSGDPKLIRRCAEADGSDKLNPDKDPHAYMAERVFGDAYLEAYRESAFKKEAYDQAKLLRDIVKRAVYGLAYGSGASTILKSIYDGGYEGPPITVNIIQRVIKTYFEEYPGIVRRREATLKRALRERKVVSPILGRHRVFPLGDVEATIAYNYEIQAGGADIMNLRTWEVYCGLADIDPTAGLIAQVHDALYAECAEDKAQEVARFIEDTLSVEWSLVEGAPTMAFTASAAISKNWKEAA
jgi:uracil-DNA glycosylase family 4